MGPMYRDWYIQKDFRSGMAWSRRHSTWTCPQTGNADKCTVIWLWPFYLKITCEHPGSWFPCFFFRVLFSTSDFLGFFGFFRMWIIYIQVIQAVRSLKHPQKVTSRIARTVLPGQCFLDWQKKSSDDTTSVYKLSRSTWLDVFAYRKNPHKLDSFSPIDSNTAWWCQDRILNDTQ